ncbi:MAG: asparagine synthase (glutamine-hydrolyzing) [Hyphomicrobiales bacterium]|nr:MAG: asparagine synthase (glutamine-hydrolyzing) [Hyphomicrobiales bacterium]
MCGINGIFSYHYAANPIDPSELVRTRDHMAPRGPDGMGEWISEDRRASFGHRRLSIIDLSNAGAQPMSNADGSLVVTFNGEIYNYKLLRRDLEAKGFVFRSNSDTEVLLHLYAARGEAMVHDLRGMFAFAIWDAKRRRMYLARDPYGIKPLYYADDGWTFRFASQVKALIAGGAISRDPEPAGVVGFYLWGSVPEPFTTYQAIRALPAGTILIVDEVGAHPARRYHSIAQVFADVERTGTAHIVRSQADAHAAIRESLLDSVRHHLVADVPVGAFLSAGVDSGALVGLMRDAGQSDIQTVTLTFDEFRGGPHDEAPLAEEVARLYSTRHATRVVTQRDFEADLPRILDAMDQPSIDGINTWFVSKAAHELGLKVAVSGLGGDELFGGYPSFRDVPRWVKLMRWPARVPGLGLAARSAGQPVARLLGLNPKFAGMMKYGGTFEGAYLLRRGLFLPWEIGEILTPEVVRQGMRRLDPLQHVREQLEPAPRGAHGKVSTLESALYMRNQLLRDTDWASMAHALEVRVPLVDSTLLQKTAPFASIARASSAKALLSNAPSTPLPSSVLNRTKTGFSTPIEHWMTSVVPPARRAAHWSRPWSIAVETQARTGLAARLSLSDGAPCAS